MILYIPPIKLIAGWVKWRLVYGVVCNKNVSPRLKVHTGSKTNIVVRGKVQANQERSRSEDEGGGDEDAQMDHTRRDMIKDEGIRGKVGVTYVVDKKRDMRLRWFRYMKSRCADGTVKRYKRLVVARVRRGRGRLKQN
ncbi:hypothetical protein H5410_042381 [Solanum commersonii]|uniref:Uncharacterized protein n=1 Tax=Solanum commersonii TaxID=4109 RepID=A0A9J5XU61_SOLCO|nr:hypothetical protein H5410_042381 [Solanum commersonii]